MAAFGALVGRCRAHPGGRGARPARRGMLVGALIGLGAAVLGLIIFFLLLSGLDGA